MQASTAEILYLCSAGHQIQGLVPYQASALPLGYDSSPLSVETVRRGILQAVPYGDRHI